MGPANSLRISRVLRYSGAGSSLSVCRIRDFHPLRSIFPNRSTILPTDFIAGPITPTVPKHRRFGLLRVRSPLLAESLLFSSPTGNEMFQFPALASPSRGCQTFHLTGCPIRTSGGLRLFAPYPGFSQLITSFFAPESLGILHAPLLLSFSLFDLRRLGIYVLLLVLFFSFQYVNVLFDTCVPLWRITDSNR